ncbi:MAG: amidohydrolase [Candidatus Aenigmatarchaeota archaeon]
MIFMKILLKNCRYILTQNKNRDILENQSILIEENKISKISKSIKGNFDEIIDCSKKLVMPGLINCHTHVAMTLMRGIADDMNLEDFLKKTFRLDKEMDKDKVKKGAEIGIIEMIKSGTTCFQDLYYYENVVAEVAEKFGMRAVLAWAVLDKEYTTQKGEPLKNAIKFSKSIKSELIKPAFGLQGVYVCSKETFEKSKKYANEKKLLLHMHLSETRKEVEEHIKKTGKSPTKWLYEIGFLSENLSAAHCVWLTDEEIKMLNEKNVSVVHCPSSNLKLASGCMPWKEMKKFGVNISLGTDGCASNNNLDMFEEMHISALIHKYASMDARVANAQEILDSATIFGAKALKINSGSVEEGKLADLITLDISDLRWFPLNKNTLISHIVYSINSSCVIDSIINGKIIMRERKILK